LIAQPLGYSEMPVSRGWPRQVDAMLYIRTRFPSTRKNALSPYAVLRAE